MSEEQIFNRVTKRKIGLCTYGGCRATANNRNGKTELYCIPHRDWYRAYMRTYMEQYNKIHRPVLDRSQVGKAKQLIGAMSREELASIIEFIVSLTS